MKAVKRAPRFTNRDRTRARRAERVTILVARFNGSVTEALHEGARRTLLAAGIPGAHVTTVRVPGAFELPAAAALAASARPKPDAIIALGALIRGETAQYEVIAHAAAQGLTQVSVASRIPVTFGVIVAERPEQAVARAGGSSGNRGVEAARAALAMLAARGALERPR